MRIRPFKVKEPMAKRSVTREVVGVVSQKSIATLYDDIEAAWLQ
jgi:hypothetical protein